MSIAAAIGPYLSYEETYHSLHRSARCPANHQCGQVRARVVVYLVDSRTFNNAPVTVAVVRAFALFSWVASARGWFAVPVKQVGDAPRAVDRTQRRGALIALP
ncbi:hypothetical protein BC826DRAFT_1190331 [Russula brevipes]|nr:hypothetical protein BC826DRAFT_1190331 [Russula brevipes]